MGSTGAATKGLKKGSKIAAEPVRNIDHIKSITQLLSGKPRDLLLWTMGINNGLRASDLVRLKVSQVEGLKAGDHIQIIEQKTQKQNVLVINKATHKALTRYLRKCKPGSDEYLFRSRKGNDHISSQSVGRLVKGWCKAINLDGKHGAHTLRKTWGYQQRIEHGMGFELICKRYNHSNPAITMRYLGIEDKEIHNLLMNEIG